jgi:hypothetical protein
LVVGIVVSSIFLFSRKRGVKVANFIHELDTCFYKEYVFLNPLWLCLKLNGNVIDAINRFSTSGTLAQEYAGHPEIFFEWQSRLTKTM